MMRKNVFYSVAIAIWLCVAVFLVPSLANADTFDFGTISDEAGKIFQIAEELNERTYEPNSVEVQRASKFVLRRSRDNGNQIDKVIVPGRPPKLFRVQAAALPKSNPSAGIVILDKVPAFNWSYGCSATAAAMMMGYYDNTDYNDMYTGPTNGGVMPMTNAAWGYGECPLSATHQGYDGRGTRGHVDDYYHDINGIDPYIGNWDEHAWEDCTGDFMGTNQSKYGNIDGATTFWFYSNGAPIYDYTGAEPEGKDGCHGMREFAESRGYEVLENYSQYILGYKDNTQGFTFAQFMEEIDNGRPVMIQIAGHSMLGFGYNSATETIYIRDTWDHNSHTMKWGTSYAGMQHYGVTVFKLKDNTQPLVIDEPYSYEWRVGSPVSETLQAHGGRPPYQNWEVIEPGYGYFSSVMDSNLFAAIGKPTGWKADDRSYSYTLPFQFPYYGNSYGSVNVSTNGFLDFTNTGADHLNSTELLQARVRIAPLWDDLTTASGNIYIDTATAGQVTFRWDGKPVSSSAKVNFSATLFDDGKIRFDYGTGNTGLTPTVGVSGGSAEDCVVIEGYDGEPILTKAKSVFFTPYSSTMPEGVQLDSSSGTLYGTPTQSGQYFVLIQLTDSASIPQVARQLFELNVTQSPQISGVANLTEFVGNPEEVSTQLEVLDENKKPVRTETVNLGPGGFFTIEDVSPGRYYLAVKPSHWLRKMVGPFDVGSESVSVGMLDLLNGDCDGDNE